MEREKATNRSAGAIDRRLRAPRIDRQELAAIFLGGFIGALARAALEQSVPAHADRWPWATFAVNMLAALLLGYFITRLQERLPPTRYRRSLLGTGLCGALSTFSTVMVELLHMIDGGTLDTRGGLRGDEPARRPRAPSSSRPSSSGVRGSRHELPGAVAGGRRCSAGSARWRAS